MLNGREYYILNPSVFVFYKLSAAGAAGARTDKENEK